MYYRALKIILSFLSNSGMGLGIQIITIYETTAEGVTFKNIAESPIDDGFSLVIVFVILIIDAILYMVLYWLVLIHDTYMYMYMQLCGHSQSCKTLSDKSSEGLIN